MYRDGCLENKSLITGVRGDEEMWVRALKGADTKEEQV